MLGLPGLVARDSYPLRGVLEDYVGDEHTIGRLLDLGIVTPRLADLYEWSARKLGIPELTTLLHDGTPAYAWDPADTVPWRPQPTRLVRTVRRAIPPSHRTGGSGPGDKAG